PGRAGGRDVGALLVAPALVWGFFVSTVLLWARHVPGQLDTSRNNGLLALLKMDRGLAQQPPPLHVVGQPVGGPDAAGEGPGPEACYHRCMRAGAAVSREADVSLAARDAATRALDAGGLDEAGCLVVAATPEHLDESIELCAALRDVVGAGAQIVGGAT